MEEQAPAAEIPQRGMAGSELEHDRKTPTSGIPQPATARTPAPQENRSPRPTIKQRIIVYTGATAAYLVLKMLLKRASRTHSHARHS